MKLPTCLLTSVLALSFAAGRLGAAEPARIWVTSADGKQLLANLAPIPAGTGAPGPRQIRIDASRRYQPVEGFGASFTESAAYLIHQRMNEAQRGALLRELFDRKTGLGLGVTRLPVGASDFSLSHHTFDDMPKGETDPALQKFSIDSARADVLPMVRAARAINPSLKVFIAPWSAPAWMKTSGSLVSGRLDPRWYDAYASYFDKTIGAFAKEGVPVYAMTMQNEPHFEPPDYPGMRMEPPERAAFIRQSLGPMLAKSWPKVKLFDWDHNWDQPESPLAVLGDAQARRYIAGVAWHCYGGNVDAQSPVHEKYPDLEVWMTECSGGNWAPNWADSFAWNVRNLIIGNLRHWGRGTIFWNLALDENHGPHAGGCADCRGVVTIDSKTGDVTRNLEYYALGHASRFVEPGARRVESDTEVDGLATVAVRNPANLVLIVQNGAPESRTFSVVAGDTWYPVTLAAGAAATLVLPAGKVK